MEPAPRIPDRSDHPPPPASVSQQHRSGAGFGDFAQQSVFETELPPERSVLPLEQPVTPRPYDGQVSFTRGGIGQRHDYSPVTPVAHPAAGGGTARLALVEALGELESARAAIGRVLAGRERSGGK
jgi:hypothetical protein